MLYRSTIEKTLNEHPEYPNMLSLIDSFGEWGMKCKALRITEEQYNNRKIDFPFIAHLNTNGGDFKFIYQISEGMVSYGDEFKKRAIISEKEFLKEFSGIILNVSKTANSGEKSYYPNRIKNIYDGLKLSLLILVALSSIIYSLNFNILDAGLIVLLISKVIGTFLTMGLLAYSLDNNNSFVQNLCSIGKANSCNSILKSESSKITSWLSWSEVGYLYFTGTLLCILIDPQSRSLIVFLNFLCIPYTIYSLTYQFRNNNWCLLCCGVVFVIWTEFFSTLFSGQFITYLSQLYCCFQLKPSILLSFAIPILIWTILKPLLIKVNQVKPIGKQLKKFKYDSNLFKLSMTSQQHYDVPQEILPIIIGNSKAAHTITIISNPSCNPCAIAHKMLSKWLAVRDDIRLQIVFATTNSDTDVNVKISRHFIALSKNCGENILEEALDDWYNENIKDHTKLILKYPVDYQNDWSSLTTEQNKWCEKIEINSNPSILVNGYKLQAPYKLEDLKYLLK